MKFGGKWTKKKWVSYTIATCSAVVLYMILSHISGIISGFSTFYGYIRPIVIGGIIAYIFNPMAKTLESKVFKKVKSDGQRWILSVAFTIILLILAVVLLGVALIPQVVESVSTFINNVGGYVDTLRVLLQGAESPDTDILGVDLSALANVGDKILEAIGDAFSNNMSDVVTTSANIGKSVFDGILAFILAIYMLLDKKRLKSGFVKLMGLILKKETFDNTSDFIKKSNQIMIRYILFDIIDGIVVGVVNFVFMLIAGMPYSVLISVVVGVTNLAPTFGPIVGAVIGGFILVLVNPWYGLIFIIFTIILQTVDGYVLKPRLFGGSLGVSPLMILISIIVGGRLFGVVGILLAIPFAAILDFTWKDYILKKLEERHSKQYNI